MPGHTNSSIISISSIVIVVSILCGVNAIAQDMTKSSKDIERDTLRLPQSFLPQKIQGALHARFPKAVIDKWTTETEDGITIYDIEFKQDGVKHEVDIREDGSIHNWEIAISIKELPKAVKKTIETKYPKAKMEEVMRVTEVKNGKEKVEGYEITLVTSDQMDVEVTVAPDGKILEASTDKKESTGK